MNGQINDWIKPIAKAMQNEAQVPEWAVPPVAIRRVFDRERDKLCYVYDNRLMIADSGLSLQAFFYLQELRPRDYTTVYLGVLAIRTQNSPLAIPIIHQALLGKGAGIDSVNIENDAIATNYFGIEIERLDERDDYALIRFSVELQN